MDDHYNHCAQCGSPNHHIIECTVGETPIQYSVLKSQDKHQENSGSSVTQEDASTEGDLINFDEDDESIEPQPSQTIYQTALKDLTIEPVSAVSNYELSPTSPNYEARFQEDVKEAIRRSLMDKDKQSYNTVAEVVTPALHHHQILSDNSKLGDMGHDKEDVKEAGFNSTAAPEDVEEYRKPSVDPSEWKAKTTPKALRNRERVPNSSLLSFQGTTLLGKDRGRGKNQKRTAIESVTRVYNQETNTMTVNSLRQKRRGRRNQYSYYDITPELQYLR